MLAIVPVKSDGAKSRLARALTPEERSELVRSMLERVVLACIGADSVRRVLVVTPERELGPPGVDVLLDCGAGHAQAISAALAEPAAAHGALVVMADCPLVTAESLDALADAARPVALVPADDGGMNALAVRGAAAFEPVFGVPAAAARTIARARAAGIEPAVLADPLLAFDVDRPHDLERLHAAILS